MPLSAYCLLFDYDAAEPTQTSVLDRTLYDLHPLAVGGDHICYIGEHPVEAIAVYHYVLGRGSVVEEDHIVAVSAGEIVLVRVAKRIVAQKVVAFPAHQIVRAQATVDEIVARATDKVLVTSQSHRAFVTTEN